MLKVLADESNGDLSLVENVETLGLKSKVSEDLTDLGPIEGTS